MSQSNQISCDSITADYDKSFYEDKDEEFRMHSATDILFILRRIMQSKTFITLYFDHGSSFILSSILAIDPLSKQIIIDYGVDENLNLKALCAAKLKIVTTQAQAEVKFTCEEIKKIKFNNEAAFLLEIPKSLVRIQRRDFFRIPTPKINALKCCIPFSEELNSDKAELALADISCGGISIIEDLQVMHLTPEVTFKNCEIRLPDIGTITATIQVKYVVKTTNNGTENKRAGCEFIALPSKMLAMIQRYVVKLEQMQRKTETC